MSSPSRPEREPRDITDLLSTRLHALAALSAASTTLRVERRFGLSLLEWRSLAHLGGFAPLSLKELARRAGLDKSYASRTIGGLIERSLVVSERNEADGRGVMLSLTAKGQALYRKVFADAVGRNERLLKPLSDEQRRQLMSLLDALSLSARRALDDERHAAEGGPEVDDAPVRGAAARDQAEPDLDEARYLVARLNDLLNKR